MEWDKVFTAGWHTDSNGNKKLWTTDDLDRMVTLFNPSFHEPPVVIGHPSDNAPAFGWVEAIKRVGNDLLLKYRDVAPEFSDWVGRKLYKKKSIAVYPDGSLRHVGYLGAMPPAVKGLPDFAFKDGDRVATFYDYEDMTVAALFRRLREFIIGKFGQDEADNILPDYQITNLQTSAAMPDAEPTDTGTPCPTFKEDDMKKEEVQALIDEALKGHETRFSEQLKGIADSIKGLGTQFGELQKGQVADREANLRREFGEFLATPEMQRRVPEGSREATVGQLMALSGAPDVEFGEGDQKKKVSAVDQYKQQLQALPEVVAFGEHASRDKVGDVTVNGMDAQELSRKAVEFQESERAAGRTVSMTDAVNHVKKGGK